MASRCESWIAVVITMLAIGCNQQAADTQSPSADPAVDQQAASDPSMAADPSAMQPAAASPSTAPLAAAAGPVTPVADGESVAFEGPVAELLASFESDPAAFQNQYDRQAIQVNGEIASIAMEPDATAALTLSHESAGALRCEVVDKQPWQSVSPGQPVTIKGRCVVSQGSPSPVAVAHAVIVESGEPTIVEIPATELAQRFVENEAQASEEFLNRYVIVTGSFQGRFSQGDFSFSSVTLQGFQNTNVYCSFGKGMAYSKMVSGLNTNAPLRILGRVEQADASNVILRDCLPVP